MEEERFEVVAVTLFGKIVVARYATLEQAEWRAGKMGEEAERNPRGYVQYLVRQAGGPARERNGDLHGRSLGDLHGRSLGASAGGDRSLDPGRAAKPALLS